MLRCCLCFGAGLVSVGTRLWFFLKTLIISRSEIVETSSELN